MNYFHYHILENDMINKYLVEFDKTKLKSLRFEIISDCSEITHYSYEDKTGPDASDYLRIRNYRAKKIGQVETSREFNETADVYHFSYDKFEFPYLITLIDNLQNGSKEAVEQIMNPDYSLEKPSVEAKIEKLSTEIDTINNLEAKKKIEKLKELEGLLEKLEINKMQKPVMPYYKKVQELINIKLVDSISMDEFQRIQNFFGIKINVEIEKPVQKVLK